MKCTLFILLLLSLSINETVYAQGVVSEREAMSVAINVATNNQNNGIIGTVKTKTDVNNRPLLYEVIMADSSAILLSGNKACIPILGEYKYSGISIVDNFEMIPCGLKCLVNNYFKQIKQCYESERQLDDNPQWNLIVNGVDTMFRNRSSVAPILSSKWGQHKSNDGLDNTAYNEFAPDSGCTYGSAHCPAGCVAVAMGQIMYHWSYPFFISQNDDVFNWCNMSDELITGSPCYEDNKKAINTLLKACGESVNMSYHCSGSSAELANARDALKGVFDYSPSTTSFSTINPGFSFETMCYRIVDELDDGRPVLMRAVDPDHEGGHAFVCDGYDRHNKAHINWGWAGSFDGYYYLNNLNPDCYFFSEQFGIVYKIEPDIVYQNQNIVYLDVFYSGFLTDSHIPYRLVPEQSDILYSASINSPSAWRTIPDNATSIYQAHEEIVLQPGFTAEYGSDFTARIEPCDACEERVAQAPAVEEPCAWPPSGPTNVNGNRQGIDTLQQEKRLYRKGDTTILFQQSELTLFPNPAFNTLTVQAPNPVEDVQLFDLAGHSVYRWYVESRTDNSATLNIANIPTGNYILRIQTSDGKTHIGRFAKK